MVDLLNEDSDGCEYVGVHVLMDFIAGSVVK